MKPIDWFKTKWARPRIRNLAILGGLLVPIAMAGTQLMQVPGTCPNGAFAALFLILTLPGQMVAGALDPIFGYRHRQSMGFFALFIAVSVLANAFVLGAIGARWDKRGKRRQNQASDATSEPAPGADSSSHQG
jgi:hypothetical protein